MRKFQIVYKKLDELGFPIGDWIDGNEEDIFSVYSELCNTKEEAKKLDELEIRQTLVLDQNIKITRIQ